MAVKLIKKFPDINTPGFSFIDWNKQFRSHNVIINDAYRNIYFPLHWTSLSLKCAFGGTEFYVIDKMKYGVDEGSYLLMNKDSMYESFIDSQNKVESFTLNFTGNFADEVYNSLAKSNELLLEYPFHGKNTGVSFFEKLYPHNPLMLSYLKDLRNLINSYYINEDMLEEKMHFILEFLFFEHIKTLRQINNIDEKKTSTKLELFRRLNLAKDYMHSNYREKIDLSNLGVISSLSPHYLLRKFKKHFGYTPHRYLTNRRLEAAKESLLRTNKSVTEICSESGFESLSSFGALFKKYYKIPPEKFRIAYRYRKTEPVKKSIFEQ